MSSESEPPSEQSDKKKPRPESGRRKREKGKPQPVEVKIVEQEQPVEVRIEKEQFEKIIAGMGEIKEALGEQTEALIREFGEKLNQLTKEVSDLKASIQKNLTTLEELRKEGEEIPPELFEKIYGAISGLERSMAYYGDQQARYNELLESQTPESLRIPTPEELLRQGGFSEEELELLKGTKTRDGKESLIAEIKGRHPETGEEMITYKVNEEIYSNKNYLEKVRKWFERQLRYLESFETAFEEQPELYNRLIIALTFFRFKKETQPLAEELHKKIEARRITKRMVRVWSLLPPEQLLSEAGRFNLYSVIAEVFCHEDEDGRKPIAEEFQNYEKLAHKLSQERLGLKVSIENLKKSLDDPRIKNTPQAKARIEMKLKELEQRSKGEEIINYFLLGGLALRDPEDENSVITNEEGKKLFVDQAIEIYQKKEALGEISVEEKRLLERLRNEFWARRFAGGLWSITFRAAKFNVILNGLNDFFAARIMNIADYLDGKDFAENTKGIWKPEKGKYKDNPLDLGFRDLFTEMLGDVLKVDPGFKGVVVSREKNEKKEKKEKFVVESLENADIGSRDFWEELSRFGVSPSIYPSTQIDNFQNADETRKFFWGHKKFLHDPDIQKFSEIIDVFKHLGNGVREKWRELTERYLEWMKYDKNAKEVQEELLIAPASVMARLIEDLSESEVLNNKARDELLEEYVNFPIPGMSPRSKAGLRVLFDTIYGVMWRYPATRHQLALGWLWELIKRSLQYTFAEELR